MSNAEASSATTPLSSPRSFSWWASCDRYMLVYVILCFLGAGILWPYNTLVSVPDYFDNLFPDAKLEFLIPAVLNYPALVLLLVMVKYGSKVSFRMRIMSCFVVFAIVAVAIPFFASIMPRDTTAQQHSALAVVIALIFCAGTFTAVLQSSLFGFTSAFPILYTQALMGGNGWAVSFALFHLCEA
jgi:equilibrative nucleoside transporter 1/2/3